MKHRVVVIVDSGVGVLIQQAVGHQGVNRLLRQIGIDGPGAEAQKGGKVVHVAGLRALQNHRDGGSLLGVHQVLLQRGNGQQGGDGHMVFVHAPVRKNHDVRPAAVGPVHLDEQPVQSLLEGGVLVVENGDNLNLEARSAHGLDLQQVGAGEDGVLNAQHRAVVRRFLQQVAVVADVHRGGGHYLLADGVQRGVGHLGKALLEVGEQGRVLLGQGGQGDIDSHGGDRLRAVGGHGQNGIL
ncbi:hypothetical protein SDC9_151075 [bioreactor metagenome]|uniref:Uncharacterized protein n=1 Tax=bioreactor metagenome TaxID=1076179 RepID=A0A645EPA5_9ZZZZ